MKRYSALEKEKEKENNIATKDISPSKLHKK